ncbi:hypothetical protein ABB37_07120 [Leptomonas pyrrhocoris]|uniref:UDP-glucoronosyl and UDP-glucosyl transferase n=1 Tax=Leptomonas pyrrhocoris TaxID=157538 RepID=A0A0M9FVZ3_LEPPY|nr:hypothetical protein ABB37_07120 [Leptomonas pyrrhocoris]XP_015655650.1 hypothetical protein ABB37_07120 [Leptomonas pyrrhocoris]KPA77210.1 hypothetical protein ABB37_07120 [Leptomonas pyrrhocoris]KPA77211.1 hypothetical protein ABB37_07120 [Leptomonas pyrrhocoris]|eukprot:XP_015655649.1 hypothetical protein ABB37_07120 [Leptomonas pyrrhocoris]
MRVLQLRRRLFGTSTISMSALLLLLFCVLVLCTVASAVAPLYHAADAAPRLHVGVMSIPLWGHLKPLWAIAEELAFRGHAVSVFVEEPSWCSVILQRSRHAAPLDVLNMSMAGDTQETASDRSLDVDCIIVPRHAEVFSEATFQPMTREGSSVTLSFVRLFDNLFQHHELSLGEYLHAARLLHERRPLTTMLCDIVTYACSSTSRQLNLPVVHSFPFTTQLSVGLHPLLPAVGLGFPRHMNLLQRTQNFAFKLLSMVAAKRIVRSLNRVRAEHGVAPFRDAYDVAGMYAPLITQTLWGLDIPQPLCPNVHPVGPLHTREQRQPYRRHDLPADLADFLDRCRQGVLYANWGTLSAPTASLEDTLREGLLAAAPYCVVWKRRSAVSAARTPPSNRFYETPWVSSPMAILKHPHTVAFVTHCGDASVLEAMEAAVPIVGFPLFADQADVCQRVAEGGIGVRVAHTKTFSPNDVVQAVATVVNSTNEIAHRMRELRAIAAAYGGPPRAADLVETRQYNLLLSRPIPLEQCSHLDGALRLDTIVMSWGAAVLLLSVLWVCVFRFTCRCLLHLSAPLARRAAAFRRAHPVGLAKPTPHRVRAVPRAYKVSTEL